MLVDSSLGAHWNCFATFLPRRLWRPMQLQNAAPRRWRGPMGQRQRARPALRPWKHCKRRRNPSAWPCPKTPNLPKRCLKFKLIVYLHVFVCSTCFSSLSFFTFNDLRVLSVHHSTIHAVALTDFTLGHGCSPGGGGCACEGTWPFSRWICAHNC